jgi:hypothetical protein
MKNYSIIRIGKEYVVQADEKSILKIASRRRAARRVSDAAELMDLPAIPPQPDAGPSNACDPAPDPQSMADPQGTGSPGVAMIPGAHT